MNEIISPHTIPSPYTRPGFHTCELQGICANCHRWLVVTALFEGKPVDFDSFHEGRTRGVNIKVWADWTERSREGRRLVLLTRGADQKTMTPASGTMLPCKCKNAQLSQVAIAYPSSK